LTFTFYFLSIQRHLLIFYNLRVRIGIFSPRSNLVELCRFVERSKSTAWTEHFGGTGASAANDAWDSSRCLLQDLQLQRRPCDAAAHTASDQILHSAVRST